MSYYKVPREFRTRIHFVRPRFKGNVENVLLYLAGACCRINERNCDSFQDELVEAIRIFPGNLTRTKKTIQNWETEISALFSFYKEDKKIDITKASKMAMFLNENQDLTQFFKLFLYSFQFPGGHLKPNENLALINKGVRFKPAKLIIQLLMEGNKIYSEQGIKKDFSVSSEELTYCVFDDSRVTSGKIPLREVAQLILDNRKAKIKYYDKSDKFIYNSHNKPRTKGDVTRYAGDILFYMELADLLKDNGHSYYSLKGDQLTTINAFVQDASFFRNYDKFYDTKVAVTTSELSKLEPLWYEYVDNQMNPDLFKTDVAHLIETSPDIPRIYKEQILYVLHSEKATTKDMGNIGESIVEGHEKTRLINAGYPELSKRVAVVDSPSYHPGYDIDSFEGDEAQIHRYIEVKTTISQKQILQYDFHMTTNEWSVASTHEEHYYVYRLMISHNGMKLYVIKDPVQLYRSKKINAIPRNGMEIHFDSENFSTTEILVCPI